LRDRSSLWGVEVPLALRAGRPTGRLLGGTLSVLATTLGTPYAPDLDGVVLFLEDVHEWPYRLDRLLTQLRQSGKLERVAGVVFGTMASCRILDGMSAIEVIRDAFEGAPYPVGFGLPAGHDPADTGVENLALPFGVEVELDVDPGRPLALEPAVV